MTLHPRSDDIHWRTSTYSSSHGGQCVEIGVTATVIALRDTKHRDAGTLIVDQNDWSGLLAALSQ